MATPAGGATPERVPGFIASVHEHLRNWVELLRVRVELFSTEAAIERENVKESIAWGAASVVCFLLGLLLGTLFIVVLFWETNLRLVVLGGMALVYLSAGYVTLEIGRRKAQRRPKMFSATLGELAKDYDQLASRL